MTHSHLQSQHCHTRHGAQVRSLPRDGRVSWFDQGRSVFYVIRQFAGTEVLKRLNCTESRPLPHPGEVSRLGQSSVPAGPRARTAVVQASSGEGRKVTEHAGSHVELVFHPVRPRLSPIPFSSFFQETSLSSSQVTIMTWTKPCPPSFRCRLFALPWGGWGGEGGADPFSYLVMLLHFPARVWGKSPHPRHAPRPSLCSAPHVTPSSLSFPLPHRAVL